MSLTTATKVGGGTSSALRGVGGVPRQSAAAAAAAGIGALSILFAYLLEGGWAGWAEAGLAVAALAALFLAPVRLASWVSIGAVALFCLVELLAGRYADGFGGAEVGRPLALAGIMLAASIVRLGIRRRDTELEAAAGAIEELTRQDRVVELLSGGSEPTWLEAELARSQRHHHHLALVLLRPDHFEEMARQTPEGGQEVLEAVAEVVGSELRQIDVALRHAPSTFALILPETPVEGARVAAERIRLLLPLRLRSVAGREITLSLGVAAFPDDASDHDALVAAATTALERAAELGGNRTVCASAPATAPPGWTLRGARPH